LADVEYNQPVRTLQADEEVAAAVDDTPGDVLGLGALVVAAGVVEVVGSVGEVVGVGIVGPGEVILDGAATVVD
jgi:hypothetical protein